jgi:hypothetical protein
MRPRRSGQRLLGVLEEPVDDEHREPASPAAEEIHEDRDDIERQPERQHQEEAREEVMPQTG